MFRTPSSNGALVSAGSVSSMNLVCQYGWVSKKLGELLSLSGAANGLSMPFMVGVMGAGSSMGAGSCSVEFRFSS